jgi:hypothetical protein
MAQKKKVVISAFEQRLKEGVIEFYEGVNGKTARMTFDKKSYSASAPSDMPKRLQKKFITKKLLNAIRQSYGLEPIED